MKLSPRMETIAGFVKEGTVIADIGTDHGYIPVELVKRGVVQKAIASDINEGPLENAREYVKENKLEDRIDIRLGGGLATVSPGEVEQAIVAGMGGALIVEILEESKEVSESIKSFVFQPMVGMVELRKYLYENGYRVVSEKLAREGEKFYQILLVEHGEEDEIGSDIYFEISAKLLESKDPILAEFLEYKIEKLKKIIDGMPENSTGKTAEKRAEIESKLAAYKEVYEVVVK